MSTIFQEWPYRWFGWFYSLGPNAPSIPSFPELIDEKWRPEDLHRILDYLRKAPVFLATSSDPARCQCCGKKLVDPGTWYWDNKWLWPITIVHDAEEHFLRLPDEMV